MVRVVNLLDYRIYGPRTVGGTAAQKYRHLRVLLSYDLNLHVLSIWQWRYQMLQTDNSVVSILSSSGRLGRLPSRHTATFDVFDYPVHWIDRPRDRDVVYVRDVGLRVVDCV
jgi:hypothetical protein